MNKRHFIILGLTLCAVSVNACSGNVQRTLGLKKHTPDEFMVLSRPPLTVPPDFNLPTPAEEEIRTQSQVRDEAKQVLFSSGKSEGNTNLSKGESGLLSAAGTDAANPNIRSILDRESPAADTQDKTVLEKIVDPLTPNKRDPLVDIDKEEERLEKNRAEGKLPSEGEVPVKEKGTRGVINELLDF